MGMKKKKKENLFKKEQNDILYVTETFRLKLDVELENWLKITGNFTIYIRENQPACDIH